jgi:hypothetical protein
MAIDFLCNWLNTDSSPELQKGKSKGKAAVEKEKGVSEGVCLLIACYSVLCGVFESLCMCCADIPVPQSEGEEEVMMRDAMKASKRKFTPSGPGGGSGARTRTGAKAAGDTRAAMDALMAEKKRRDAKARELKEARERAEQEERERAEQEERERAEREVGQKAEQDVIAVAEGEEEEFDIDEMLSVD